MYLLTRQLSHHQHNRGAWVTLSTRSHWRCTFRTAAGASSGASGLTMSCHTSSKPMIIALLLMIDACRFIEPTTYRCDIIELNHFHCPQQGCHRFSQVIVWSWKPEVRAHHVDTWWLVAGAESTPRRTASGYVAARADGVRFTADAYRETWTTIDPELADKQKWPESRRVKYEKTR
jgi:hypothetical protein